MNPFHFSKTFSSLKLFSSSKPRFSIKTIKTNSREYTSKSTTLGTGEFRSIRSGRVSASFVPIWFFPQWVCWYFVSEKNSFHYRSRQPMNRQTVSLTPKWTIGGRSRLSVSCNNRLQRRASSDMPGRSAFNAECVIKPGFITACQLNSNPQWPVWLDGKLIPPCAKLKCTPSLDSQGRCSCRSQVRDS